MGIMCYKYTTSKCNGMLAGGSVGWALGCNVDGAGGREFNSAGPTLRVLK